MKLKNILILKADDLSKGTLSVEGKGTDLASGYEISRVMSVK